MKSYGLFWGAIGLAVGTYVFQNTNAPQAMGVDPGSLWEKYGPAILGIFLAAINNKDWPLPDFVKKLVGIWAKDKGADIDMGNRLLDLWKRAVDVMNDLKNDPTSSPEAIESAKDTVHRINQQVMEAGAKK